MDIEKIVPRLWAKSAKSSAQAATSVSYHPVLFHLIDVAAVVRALLLQPRARPWIKRMAQALEIGLDELRQWLMFWSALHDLGKVSSFFQFLWEEAKRHLTTLGLSRVNSTKYIPHGLITAWAVEPLLQTRGLNGQSSRRIARLIGAHHGRLPNNRDIFDIEPSLKREGEAWSHLRQWIFDRLAELFNINRLSIPPIPDDHCLYVHIAAMTSVADWIGSIADPGFFEFTVPSIPVDQYYETVLPKAEHALSVLGWSGWNSSTTPMTMEDLFPVIRDNGAKPVQVAVKDIADDLAQAGLLIIEAPMGQGKTEAAMFVADQWAVQSQQTGCYFALPTQATSNQMFTRIMKFLKTRYPENIVNLQLLHGHAHLSADFEIIRRNGDRLLLPRIEPDQTNDLQDGSVIAAEWFTFRKRGLLAPFGVGTVDQALMSVLQTRHYFVRLLGLAGKTVVIDEVHAYDTYMTTLLENLMEWLAALGSTVLMLSATLPRTKRKKLTDAYRRGCSEAMEVPEPPDCNYPRLTWVGQSVSGSRSIEVIEKEQKEIHLEWLPQAEERFDLGARLRQYLEEGGCAAVICNTVDRAQKTYQALKPFFPAQDAGDGYPELDLFHSRFMFRDRAEREARCLKRFGQVKAGVKRPKRAVLVATQVIEQSLDLDFDLMVSEIAPMDFILQRAGRLHRHERSRPNALSQPSLWLFLPVEEDAKTHFGSGTEAVYEPLFLQRTWSVLKGRNRITLPDEIETLVEAVYESGFDTEGQDASTLAHIGACLARQQNAEAQARMRTVPGPRDEDLFERVSRDLFEDDPEAHPSLLALTRLSGPSVNLVVLWGSPQAPKLDPYDENIVDLENKPNSQLVRELLTRSLNLSLRKVVGEILEHGERPPGWASSAWLRHHRLMVLDSENSARLGRYRLTMDRELGLLVSHE
ncbi:MAG: CRISPR-associated helicase Cas3' [Thermodesulfobacteriota bacterium]